MPQMLREYLKQTGQKINTVEDLCGSIETPIKKFDERHQSVGLVHVVAVLSDTAEERDDPNHRAQQLAQLLNLTLLTRGYSFADLDQQWHEFKFTHQVQIARLLLIQHFY